MRRLLRPWLPRLSADFGLRWEHIEAMPLAELHAYLIYLFAVVDLDDDDLLDLWHAVLVEVGLVIEGR